MAQFNFNAAGIQPQYEAGGGLPVGKHPVVISGSTFKATKDGQGSRLVFELTAIDGPAKGQKMDDGLNVQNPSQQAMEIAYKQLAAYCAVVGVPAFQDTGQLHDKPFIIEVRQQPTNPQYVEIVAIYDINGNKPGQGAGQQQQQQTGAVPAPQWQGGGGQGPGPGQGPAPGGGAPGFQGQPSWAPPGGQQGSYGGPSLQPSFMPQGPGPGQGSGQGGSTIWQGGGQQGPGQGPAPAWHNLPPSGGGQGPGQKPAWAR